MQQHKLPDWEIDDLPAPPPFTVSNLFKVIGPGATLLAASIGSGEWLLGPAAVLKSGPSLLTIVTISVVFQVVVNMARGLIPAGTGISELAAGAYQAEYLSQAMGKIWWTLTPLNGF